MHSLQFALEPLMRRLLFEAVTVEERVQHDARIEFDFEVRMVHQRAEKCNYVGLNDLELIFTVGAKTQVENQRHEVTKTGVNLRLT